MLQSDKPFIYDSFMRGFNGGRHKALFSRGCIASKLINALFRQSWEVVIACDEETPGEILGWVLHHGPQNIGWICVKGPVQGKRIAHKLLEFIGTDLRDAIFAPFVSNEIMDYAQENGIRIEFKPYMVCQ